MGRSLQFSRRARRLLRAREVVVCPEDEAKLEREIWDFALSDADEKKLVSPEKKLVSPEEAKEALAATSIAGGDKKPFFLAFGRAPVDRDALSIIQKSHRLTFPRQWSKIPRWKDLASDEVDRILNEHGQAAFRDLKKETKDSKARGALLRKKPIAGQREYEWPAIPKGRKREQSEPQATDALEPRLFDRSFCPLLPAGLFFAAALGHFRRSPEAGFTLYGTASKAGKASGGHVDGLVAVLGYPLAPGRAHDERRGVVRQALEDLKAVAVDYLGGVVVGKLGARDWLPLDQWTDLDEKTLCRKLKVFVFLPLDWNQRRRDRAGGYVSGRSGRLETTRTASKPPLCRPRGAQAQAHGPCSYLRDIAAGRHGLAEGVKARRGRFGGEAHPRGPRAPYGPVARDWAGTNEG
jgi:hypothetical protein